MKCCSFVVGKAGTNIHLHVGFKWCCDWTPPGPTPIHQVNIRKTRIRYEEKQPQSLPLHLKMMVSKRFSRHLMFGRTMLNLSLWVLVYNPKKSIYGMRCQEVQTPGRINSFVYSSMMTGSLAPNLDVILKFQGAHP